MPKLRVLVVDDAVVVRRLVSDALNADPEIEVCGTASNGKLALDLLPQLAPDAVTLDVEMPELDGLSTLKELRKKWPRLPVVMLSALTEKGASVTLDCLSAGASGYVTKPAGAGSMGAAVDRVRSELAPMLKALCNRKSAAPAAAPLRAAIARPRAGARANAEIVAIGVSTGGPNALAEVVPALPASLGVPVVIVQHMPPVFTRLLAERLSSKSALPVTEAIEGETLQAGHVYIAPGDFHMTLQRHGTDVRIALDQEPPENSCRPAVDPLFRSVSALYGDKCLGVILTGMGKDGLRGCELFREKGAQILAQDEETSVVWGMPGFVAREGLADEVLPLSRVAPEIVRRVALRANRLIGAKK